MLDGIRIIEIEGLGPGPFAAMMLADLGADVIVVHRKGGGGAGAPDKAARNLLDRGKRSIALDLKDPADMDTVKRLVACSDGLIEGFRPGVMERLGLGPEDAHGINPALVYGRMTGWGQDGPRSLQAGHDLNYIGLSGALWYASPAGQPPFTPPTMVGDIGGGALYLVAGMLAGIIRAGRSGRGTVVDAAIVDGSAHMMNLLMSLNVAGGLSMMRGQSLLDGPHWSRCYTCADGKFLSVQCLEPKFYAIFLELLGLSDDADFAARQYDKAAWPDLSERLAAMFAAQPLAHWLALFDGSDACVGPVNAPDAAAGDAHIAARGIWQQSDGVLQAAAAPRFDGQAPDRPRPAPERGQDTDAILAELAGD
ncbi:CoA transferase [Lutimaribacter sp. EGI FJ00015]|uniref:CoA transferase n=1 Tax=Lutimaribacter degradans TaxID=2945989 RepID=A0ACC5ZYI6_9RHOB|nr:CaiB/BaiF CoA-transferase family protein [Lutimaribacter sp. EGI FJ00013]MCM2562983.1 CoA transferase [Lutimaribacter sp. EGI FJ00013]MCO0614151.1 CoA transferase [Lutimaribacter sp. EGI FJ00015]MCO0636128.1 CoA transferase [Lutimaribacter sp. EGI FJ00014]